MKILHINKSDIQGGAARGAYRLHTGLRKIGVDSKIIVDDKISDDPNVYGPKGKISKLWSKVRPFIDRAPLKFYDWQGTPFHLAWMGRRDIQKHELVRQADILNLHWIAGGFLSIKGISRLAKLDKPIVWTLHDMWAFTGGCHYSIECERYISSCGACAQLDSRKDNDITRKIWRKKEKAYKDLDLTIVTLSRWLAECAKRSSLLRNFGIEVIPNGLDTGIFKPINKLTARNVLNLPKNKKIILFGAMNPTINKLKGYQYLKKAINKLKNMKVFNEDRLCLVIFGASYSEDIEKFPFEVKFLGRLYDNFSLALSYSAADVFVGPSLQEAFGQTYIESMSCGTPCVAFDYSGPKDMIDHKVNGYLAEYKNPESLAEGIKWILEDENRALRLREAARKKAVEKYSLKIQAERYVDLYKALLQNRI